MHAHAVVFKEAGKLELSELELARPGDRDVVVDVEYSGISTGTERLLWTGRMPSFPGMGYPLVPGYEAVGRISSAGRNADRAPGDFVFVPGASCFGPVRGLFGAAASRLVVPAGRTLRIDDHLGERGVLLALAATAHHALASAHAAPPDLVVGHGILGRLLARIALAHGDAAPTVWERDATRRSGSLGYPVLDPAEDPRRDYRSIYDASGDASLIDLLVSRLAHGGEIVLAGFYEDRPSFAFPPAFMREARFRIAAEWKPTDLDAVRGLVSRGELSLDGLITNRTDAAKASTAYETAFGDPRCLKMVLDWRSMR